MKQWELPNNSKVHLPNGTTATFLYMDGMYAKWDVNGKRKTGNFEAFEATEDGYKVVTPQKGE